MTVVEKEATVEVDCNSVLVLVDVVAAREVDPDETEGGAEGVAEVEGCLIH